MADIIIKNKPLRFVKQQTRRAVSDEVVGLHGQSSVNTVWGSDHHANFIDIISVAPITSFEEIFIDDVNIKKGEFPRSLLYTHDGVGRSSPWSGNFPYVERTYAIDKQVVAAAKDVSDLTSFVRSVSSLGVAGIRLNFTTGGFTQKDNKGRDKAAQALFTLRLLDVDGNTVQTVSTSSHQHYSSLNPTAIQLTLEVPEEYKNTLWSYEVLMDVKGKHYSVAVNGNWRASTVTELFLDTQTYEDIAYCSGDLIANEMNKKPTRQYIVKGYKVLVPLFQDVNGKDVFTGLFDRKTSDNAAWNAMAVLTDTKWGAALPLDRINTLSFLNFAKHCSTLVDGVPRYSHSQYLIKADNYFKLASQIVGSSDGRLFEDSNGRLGILVDAKTDNRRVLTSYDLVDEKVKRTTVPQAKKINHVEGTFDDKTNNYKKTIVSTSDQLAIDKSGVITKKIKLDGCTEPKEANRVINRMLVTSQVATSTYMFSVGHNHEDLQIGEVVALYDRLYSRINACGKIASGSTTTIFQVDKRTPVDISMMSDPRLVLDNSRGIPIVLEIDSNTAYSITLKIAADIPSDFTSFAIEDYGTKGIKPTLVRVLGLDSDDKGVISVEGVEYNHSIYDHVELGTPLEIPNLKYIPLSTSEVIAGVSLSHAVAGITANWTNIVGWNYKYFWKRYGDADPKAGITVASGNLGTDVNTVRLDAPLDSVEYSFHVYGVLGDKVTPLVESSIEITVDESGASVLPPATNLGVKDLNGDSVGVYTGRDFEVMWQQDISLRAVKEFIVRVSQSGKTLEKRLSGSLRSSLITESELIEVFGSGYLRSFTLGVITVDSDLLSSTLASRAITNIAPDAPTVFVRPTGDLSLTGTQAPDRTVTNITVWKGIDVIPPVNAFVFDTQDLSEIDVPDDVIEYDGSTYTFIVGWVDIFGKVEMNTTRTTFVANPALMVPIAPELLNVISIQDDSVKVTFSHNGVFLKKIISSYRVAGSNSAWTDVGNVLTIPVGNGVTTHGYDISSGEGYYFVNGLATNTEYEFKCTAANDASSYSSDSNIVQGMGFISVSFDGILDDIDDGMNGIDARDLIAEGVLDILNDFNLNDSVIRETFERKTETETVITDVTLLQAKTVSDSATTAATFSNVTKLITDEETARIADVSKLTVDLESEASTRSGSITSVNSLIINETTARGVLGTNLNTRIETEETTRESSVTSLGQSIATEGSTRASQINTITARVDGQSSDIATALNSSAAAIGWCQISGVQSAHEDQASCEAATGTWVPTPLATAVNRVKVTSGVNTATVGAMYEAFVDLDGAVQGKAVLGVTAAGVFTGLSIVGGADKSSIIFKGSTIEFQNAAGAKQLKYENGTWNFYGVVYAENIQGDVMDAITKDIPFTSFPSEQVEKLIVSFNVTALPFDRVITVSPIQYQIMDRDFDAVRIRLKRGSYVATNGTTVPAAYVSGHYYYSLGQDKDEAKIGRGQTDLLVDFLPANAVGTYTVVGDTNTNVENVYVGGIDDAVIIQAFKKGSTLS